MNTLHRLLLIIVFAGYLSNISGQNPVAWRLYNGEGEKINWQKMVKDLNEKDVVFFGELHNNAIAHWLQLELTKELFLQKEENLILGAEMFERDNQIIMNEYLEGLIRNKDFTNEARLWDNYSTDYAPLVEFAKEKKLRFIATNIPRRYAALVNRSGFEALDSLTDQSKQWIAPLPVPYDPELECYAYILRKSAHMPGKTTNPSNLPKAQAIKDATMAHFIVKSHQKGDLFLHFNGNYHSDKKESIVWYLRKYKKKLKVATISVSTSNDPTVFSDSFIGDADYIIVVDKDVTNTY